MKTTSTLLDIIEAKAKRLGYNAFIDENGLFRLQDDNTSIMSQIVRYTPFIKSCTEDEIFGGFSFKDKGTDIFFKRIFLTKFLNRQIKFQTVDLFRSKLVFLMLSNEQWFTEVYNNFDSIFNGKNTQGSQTESHAKTESRGANATLPQDQTELNLDDDNVPFADSTVYNRGKNDTTGKNNQQSNSSTTGVIQALDNLYSEKLKEFDPQLFLQIW